jgi:hypothetical protein
MDPTEGTTGQSLVVEASVCRSVVYHNRLVKASREAPGLLSFEFWNVFVVLQVLFYG